MLVLGRQRGERIIVNPGTPGEIVITLVSTGPGAKARLGFDAPREVVIVREELRESSVVPAGGRP